MASIAVLLVLSAVSVALYMKDVGSFFVYQTLMRSTVSWACGRSFSEPLEEIESLRAFVALQQATFDCADLSEAPLIGRASPFARAHFYLAWCVALLWRLFGVKQTALWPLAFLLHAAYVTGTYMLARLFVGRALSLFVGVAIAVSPIAISMLFLLRDYAKAPFIVWSVVAMIAAVRSPDATRAIGLTAAAGALVGIGSGFRADVTMLMLPFALAAACLGADKISLMGRLSAIAVLFGAFAVMASPRLVNASSYSGAAFLQGTTEGFHRHLMLGSAAYDFGANYSDELTLSAVAADLRKNDPKNYDAHESQPNLGISQASAKAPAYFVRYALMFPADVLMRGMKSAVLVSGFFPLLRPDMRVLDPFPDSNTPPPARFATRLLSPIWIGLGTRWLPIVTMAGLVLLLAREFAASPRAALALGSIFGTLLLVPGFQFSLRHVFHMESIAWLALAAIWPAISALRRHRISMLRFTLWCAGFLVAAMLLYALALLAQTRIVTRETASLLNGPRRQIPVRYEPQGDQTLLAMEIPEGYRPLVFGATDSLTAMGASRGGPWDVRAMSDRLLVTLNRRSCSADTVDLTFAYHHTSNTWQPFDRAVTAKFSEGHDEIRIVYPAFYRPTQYFEGIRIDSSARPCIDRIEKLQFESNLQSIFFIMLDGDPRNASYHLRFGWF